MMIKFLMFLGVFNLIILNIRLIIGAYNIFNNPVTTRFVKWFNLLETMATIITTYILVYYFYNN